VCPLSGRSHSDYKQRQLAHTNENLRAQSVLASAFREQVDEVLYLTGDLRRPLLALGQRILLKRGTSVQLVIYTFTVCKLDAVQILKLNMLGLQESRKQNYENKVSVGLSNFKQRHCTAHSAVRKVCEPGMKAATNTERRHWQPDAVQLEMERIKYLSK